ncbi:alpha-1,3-galactosidase-related protein [Maribellus maritimus]|uniref:alpha-1,3-galactosidase-related protein n=1 Tax=Maribellus maritimus TaxID=2870838 RepID=UPI001EEBF86A|nr:right-handed parallel beta-helix repeat-containing protein [Maribellus maritimus]MCG6188388.1 right-handed parallel beta-helix repeat-containing protein [Maribellus maritimus]
MKLTLSFFLIYLSAYFVQSFLIPQNKINQRHTALNDTVFYHVDYLGLPLKGKENCISLTNKVLNDIRGEFPKILVFKPGTYHFYPEGCEQRNYFESNTTDINPRICAFLFEGAKNLVVEGNGSNFIFHGQMQPFTFDNCENITLKNIQIDWENPLTAQVEVAETGEKFIDLNINQKEYSYKITDGKIFFNGEDWEEQWKGTMEFDREGRYVVPQTGDWGCLGKNWQNYEAKSIIPGLIRLENNFERKPKVGNYLVMRHSERLHSGIFIQNSKNINIKNVTLYHATGLGILAQFSENLTFDKYKAIPNAAKNRYFGGGDDGLQVSNCKGQITVSNCEFAGLMDDPINVHGTSVQVIEILPDKKIRCKFMHHQSEGLQWGHAGDKIGFIENTSMNTFAFGEAESFKPTNRQEFILTLKEELPQNLETGDALENLTWVSDLTVQNSHFKSCRARGILVSTPGKVMIENNTFESSGSAILIAGDANNWFESGAVKDVTIRNNTFTELCNTSSYQFCEGIISIYPEIPELNKNTPFFHKNIRITGNKFNPFDYPVVFARSVDGLSFSKNTIKRSKKYAPYHQRKYTFTFEACKNIIINENNYIGDVLGKNILLNQTNFSEIEVQIQENLKIETL